VVNIIGQPEISHQFSVNPLACSFGGRNFLFKYALEEVGLLDGSVEGCELAPVLDCSIGGIGQYCDCPGPLCWRRRGDATFGDLLLKQHDSHVKVRAFAADLPQHLRGNDDVVARGVLARAIGNAKKTANER